MNKVYSSRLYTSAQHESAAQARGGAAFAGTGDSLYVVGGFNGKELGDMHMFDVAAGSWKQLDMASAQQQLPPRSVAGIVAVPSPGQLPSGEFVVHFCGANHAAWLMASEQQVACASSSSHPPILPQRRNRIRGVMPQAAAAAAVACCCCLAVRWSRRISATKPPVRTAGY